MTMQHGANLAGHTSYGVHNEVKKRYLLVLKIIKGVRSPSVLHDYPSQIQVQCYFIEDFLAPPFPTSFLCSRVGECKEGGQNRVETQMKQ